MRDLTEDEVLQAVQAANLGGNTIRLTFDSGHCEVTRSTRAADLLAAAIVRKFCEVNGIAAAGVPGLDDAQRNVHAALRRLIADDGYAMTFQTMGQYRTALLRAIDGAAAAAGAKGPEHG